jgi:hypothetical protein
MGCGGDCYFVIIVQFFGTGEYAWVQASIILTWGKGIEKKYHQKKSKSFIYALEDVVELEEGNFEPSAFPAAW